jgi:long-chain fatty acid transport protein
MRLSPLKLVFAALIMLVPVYASAAGFLIFEEGAKALGMGGAFTAQANDASAVFFNPAGICQIDGNSLYLGDTAIITNSDFAGVDPDPGYGVLEHTKTQVFTPVNLYITGKINDNLSAGFGIFNPFGLGREWENPETFTGRHIAYKVDLKSFFFNPTLAWKVNDKISFGAGLQLAYSSVLLKQYILQWDPNGSGYLNVGRLELDGNNTLDAGYNVGILIKPNDDFSIGVSYRSSVKVDYDGDADFTQISTGNSSLDSVVATQLPQDQGVKTKIEFPPLLSVGVAFKGIEKWTFEVDLNWVGWSTFDALPFDFQKDDVLDTSRPQKYEDKFSVRSGAQYSASENLSLRAGYYFDPSPQPALSVSPLLPDSDRHGITFGLGYTSGPWTVDLFDLILVFKERDTEGKNSDGYNGTYSSWANLIGMDIGYNF